MSHADAAGADWVPVIDLGDHDVIPRCQLSPQVGVRRVIMEPAGSRELWRDRPPAGDRGVCVARLVVHDVGSQVSTSLSTVSAPPSTRRSTSPLPGMISDDMR